MYEYRLNGVDLSLPKGLATPAILEKLANGTYEEDEARAAERCVRQGFRVLELGAGIGYVTTLARSVRAPKTCSRSRRTPTSCR